MSRSRKILLWLGGSLLGLLALGVAAVFILASTPWARDLALQKAAQAIEQETGYRLSVGGSQGSLMGVLELSDISLSKGGKMAFAARELVLDPYLPALLGGRVKINLIRLVQPKLVLPLDLPEGGSGGMPVLAVSLKRIEITGGSLETGGQWGPVERLEGVKLQASLRLDRRGLRAQARELSGRAFLTGAAPIDLDLKAKLQDSKVELTQGKLKQGANLIQLSGDLDFGGALIYRAEGKGVLPQIELLPLQWPGPHPPQGPVNLSFKAKGKDAALELKADLGLADSSLSLEGELQGSFPSLHIKALLKGVDAKAWGLYQKQVKLDGRAEADMRGQPGRRDSFSRISLDLEKVEFSGLAKGSLRAEASVGDGRVELASLRASGPWGALQAKGWWRFVCGACPNTIEAEIQFQDLAAPAALSAMIPASLRKARLRGGLKLAGRLDDLGLKLALDRSALGPDNVIDSLQATGRWLKQDWLLEKVDLTAPWGWLRAEGRADKKKADLQFSLHAPKLPPLLDVAEGFLDLDIPQVNGEELSLSGHLTGPWQKPSLTMLANADLIAYSEYHGESVGLDMEFTCLFPRPCGRLSLIASDLWEGDIHWQQLALDGFFEGGRLSADFEAHGFGWHINAAVDIPRLLTKEPELELLGLRLTPRDQSPWRLLNSAKLAFKGGQVTVQGLSLARGRERVSLEGSFGLSGEVSAKLMVQKFKLAPWVKSEALPKGAVLNLSASLKGSLTRPIMEIQGTLSRLVWLKMPRAKVEFSGSYMPANLRAGGKVFTGRREVFDLKSNLHVEISLSPPKFRPGPAGFWARLKGEALPISLFQPLLSGISDLNGEIYTDLMAKGPLSKPALRGQVRISDAAFNLDFNGQGVEHVDATLRLAGRRVTLEDVSLKLGGLLRLGGYLDIPLGDDGKLDAYLKGTDLEIPLASWGSSKLDLGVTLKGDFKRPRIKGSVKPTKLKVYVGVSSPAELESEVVVMKAGEKPPPIRQEKKAASWRPTGLLGRTDIDLGLSFPDDFQVELPQGWLKLGGGMILQKPPDQALVYNGKIDLKEGAVFIEGRKFVIQKGEIDFGGRDSLDPSLSVQATHRAGNVLVFVVVSGRVNNPSVQLSSQPSMSRADILSTIIFGKPANSLSGDQSQQLQAQALALLGQQGAKEIQDILGTTLAPDVVTVHSEAETGPSLEAGKYLGPDIYLRYRQNLGEDGGRNVGLEYRLKRWLFLESQVGTTRDTGVDVIFNWDY